MCFLLLLLWWTAPALAEGFLCAGSQGSEAASSPEGTAAKPARIAQSRTTGTRRALVLFARFKGENTALPSWAGDIFKPDLPGSFSHFYDTMSFGKLQVRGESAPRVYESAQPASAYLSANRSEQGEFGQFAQEVLRQADQDIDFAQYDNDGPDGVPNSGDDDGVVDAVFLVLDRIPSSFLLGEATGIMGLGFTEVFLSSDTGVKGKTIQIFPGQGTIQQGRFFAEAVGSMCHEYGHVLGLPDLYNTEFLGKKDAGPEEDGAGVGAWCLMGWGASGWNENDGPNSFCAWSRMKLGWSPVISPSHEREQLELKDVGQRGAIYQFPVNDREAFLVEYRRRGGNYYDRHIPAEGVLIWHISQRPLLLEYAGSLQLVDLECADGRWRDAGYPQGKEPDSSGQGGDNLDFWAHDDSYAHAHAGNLGDATDPFDGERFTAFTPQTNPSSYSSDGQSSVRVEHIHIENGIAHLEVQTAPRRLVIENFRITDASGDGVLGVGEEAELRFWVANRGGVNVSQVHTVLSTEDSLVEILYGEFPFHDLKVGEVGIPSTVLSLGPLQGFVQQPDELSPVGPSSQDTIYIDVDTATKVFGVPQFHITGDFAGTHTAALHLEVYSGSELIEQHPFTATAGAARQRVQELSLIDSSGNGDGQAQAGEIAQLSITLADQHEAVLPVLGFFVRSLDERAVPISSSAMLFRMVDDHQARSVRGPEFLLSSTLEVGTELPFELEVNGVLGTWKDTVYVQVHEGGDQTPPRVSLLRTQAGESGGLEVLLADRWIIDGSALRSARAIFYSSQDTSQLAVIPLERQESGFAGAWEEAPPGAYLVAGEVEDVAGNRGRSPLLRVTVVPRGVSPGDSSLVRDQFWEQLHLSEEQTAIQVTQVAMAPSNPGIVYAADLTSLWRSEDGGQTWNKTGLMFNGLFNLAKLFVDPQDPFTLYLAEYNQVLKSHDGGQHWTPIRLPDQDFSASLLGVDAVLPGRIYGYSSRRSSLLVSEDEGRSWKEIPWDNRAASPYSTPYAPYIVVTHPAAPQNTYIGNSQISWGADKAGILWLSSDGGNTWQEVELDRVIRGISPDPSDPNGLYGAGTRTVWYSADRGRTWQDIGQGISGNILGVQAHLRAPEVVYAWGGTGVWISRDRGSTWKGVGLPSEIASLSLDPGDPGRSFLVLSVKGKNTLWKSENYGETLEQVEINQGDAPAGAMVFNPNGQPFVASLQGGEPGIFTSENGGGTWEWQLLSPIPFLVKLLGLGTFLERVFVDPVQPQIVIGHYALGWNQFVRSVDGGRTWREMSEGWGGGSGTGATLRSFPQLVSDPDQPGVYYLSSDQIRHSTDFGETWEQRGVLPDRKPTGGYFVAGQSPVTGLLLDPTDHAVLYAAKGDGVWFNRDVDQKWVEINQVQPEETILTLAFHPVDAVGMYAVTTGGIYLSANRAQTWAPLFKPEGIRWTSAQLRFDPRDPSHIYLVTSRYLYESSDAGKTWVEIGKDVAGFPWFNDLAFDPLDASVVYVTTTWGVYKLDRTPVITAVEETPTTPATFSLDPNYPNPFNPTTTLRFTLPQASEAELAIYNLLGQRVTTLVRGVQEAGNHVLQWDGRDEAGRELASGVYFYRLQAGTQVETRKLLLLR